MAALQIDCRPFFHPLSSLPAYAGTAAATRAQQRNSAAYAISPYGINLPSGLSLTQDHVAHVASSLKRILRQSGTLASRENAA
jgi:perosamine synthetase